MSAQVEQRLQQIDDIIAFVRKTGRAELDEHAEGVNVTEIIATIDPHTERSREEVIEEISEALADIPGIVTAVEQPLAHLISHMLSGVKAQVAIKLYGDDLDVLRREAQKMQAAIADVRRRARLAGRAAGQHPAASHRSRRLQTRTVRSATVGRQ